MKKGIMFLIFIASLNCEAQTIGVYGDSLHLGGALTIDTSIMWVRRYFIEPEKPTLVPAINNGRLYIHLSPTGLMVEIKTLDELNQFLGIFPYFIVEPKIIKRIAKRKINR